YMANAARMGELIMKKTADWKQKHKTVGDIRGRGLMIGVEFVRDQKTKEKAPDLRNKIVEKAFYKGLLVLGSGDTTLRLCPPLLVDEEQIDFALHTLDGVISDVERSI
ncbi:MAG TPA: aminotransferase class III-fold pyridoxal phosphate-dependent enzyme, partial [Candidatus Acidoferrales bacterium]|nr:aminotransferase class III-fold pyridoxal phosphate-dependent enzyme [Candidatus Acidoferrales bacterium]